MFRRADRESRENRESLQPHFLEISEIPEMVASNYGISGQLAAKAFPSFPAFPVFKTRNISDHVRHRQTTNHLPRPALSPHRRQAACHYWRPHDAACDVGVPLRRVRRGIRSRYNGEGAEVVGAKPPLTAAQAAGLKCALAMSRLPMLPGSRVPTAAPRLPRRPKLIDQFCSNPELRTDVRELVPPCPDWEEIRAARRSNVGAGARRW